MKQHVVIRLEWLPKAYDNRHIGAETVAANITVAAKMGKKVSK